MGEPARKLEDIEPDIRPNLRVIDGGLASPKSGGVAKQLNNLESASSKPNTGSINDQESAGSNVIQGPWKNSVTGSATSAATGNRFKSFVKKKGPMATIASLILGGGFGISMLLSPGLLLVQVKEVLVNKFNTQLTSMDIRSTRIISQKISKSTTGLCTSSAKILCKYSSMSEKQVSKFEKAGVKINYEKSAIPGRVKPTSFEFDGEEIPPEQFKAKLSSDPKFRSAVKDAYNPKFAGFMDNVWKKVSAKLGISKKAANLEGDTDEEKLASMEEDVKTDSIDSDEVDINADEAADEAAAEAGEDGAEAASEAAKEAAEAGEKSAKELAEGAGSLAGEVAEGGLKASTKTLAGALKLSGPADTVCSVYTAIQAVGYAAKTVRTVQLARYAMIFLNVADQIKSGTAKAKDVSYLGKILTTEFITENKDGTKTKKTATDSFGYKYAAYGTTGKMSTTASQFLAGGGLTGDLINTTAKIESSLGGSPKGICKLLSNPLVGGLSMAAGVAMLFAPGGLAAMGIKDIAQAATETLFNVALGYLPALLQDIVAGVLVDKTTVGEAAGDAIVSGASGMMSSSAALGGNAPLTPDEAVAYSELSNKVAAEYAEEDQLAYSPFDITNSNTFMGKIALSLTPYLTKMSSLSGAVGSVASIVTGSFSHLAPSSAKAATADDYRMCQDYDYRELDLATDPYCNVMYGIPQQYLDIDPSDVASKLLKDNQIDEDGNITGDNYKTFLDHCVNRQNPLGYDDSSDSNDSNGSECKINDSNKYFYLYQIDQRVLTGMEDL